MMKKRKISDNVFFCLFKLFFLSFSLASTKILLVTIIQNKRNEKKIIFWGVLFPYFFNKLTEELREETFETKFYLNFEGEWLQNPCSLQSGHQEGQINDNDDDDNYDDDDDHCFPYSLNCKRIVETLASIFSDAVTINNVSDASGITAVAGERIRKNSRTSSSMGQQ